MTFRLLVEEGLRNILAARLRSLLALLGILVGCAAVVALISGGELAAQEALSQFQSLGTDLLAVTLTQQSSEEKSGAILRNTLTVQTSQFIAHHQS